MSSYDNPRIIEDLYGSMAWAKAAAQLSGTLVKSVQDINAARATGYEAAKKKKEKANLITARISLEKNRILNANVQEYGKSVGYSKTLMDQYQENGKKYLDGFEGFMGSIEAETLYMTDSNATAREREEWQKTINASNTYQDNMINFAANLTPELKLIGNQNQSTIEGYYWEGNTPEDQAINMLTGHFLDGVGMTDSRKDYNVESTKKIISDFKTGENKLLVTHRIHEDNGIIAGDFKDTEKYPRDKDGYITLEFEKDINKWNGKFLTANIKGVDMTAMAKTANIETKTGDIATNLKSPVILKEEQIYKDGVIDVGAFYQHSDEFVDVPLVKQMFGAYIKNQKYAKIMNTIGSPDNGERSYITDTLMINDFVPDTFFERPLEQRKDLYMEWEIQKYLRDKGLSGPGDPANNLPENQDLILRKIDKNDALIINDGKAEGDPSWVKVDQMGYFIRKTQDNSKGTIGERARHRFIQKENIKTGANMVLGSRASGYHRKMIVKDKAGNYKQYILRTSSVSLSGDSTEPGVRASSKQEDWKEIKPGNNMYIKPGADGYEFETWLGY
tara:strand:- start:152 stop:1834 length:1683 start_codon:yes stop_codon:yes gene_type:complete